MIVSPTVEIKVENRNVATPPVAVPSGIFLAGSLPYSIGYIAITYGPMQ